MSEHRFLDTAYGIGTTLCRDALWWQDRCTWLQDDVHHTGRGWHLARKTCAADLYEGTAGIALFLARLAAYTNDPIIARVARGAARQTHARASNTGGVQGPGLYAGQMGSAYAIVQAGECLRDEGLIAAGMEIAERVAAIDGAGWEGDIIGGSAGAIIVALHLQRFRRRTDLHTWAHAQGDRLINCARKTPQGTNWATDATAPALTGIAHGAAGIAWALGELATTFGEDRFRAAAMSAIRFEDACFDPERANWADCLPTETSSLYRMAWCYGAPGIALTRLRLWQLFDDPKLRADAAIAVSSTVRDLRATIAAPGRNFSLCHGLAGNADILIDAHRVLGDEEALQAAAAVGVAGIEDYAASGLPWPSGVGPDGASTPGLMLGLAGIGHFYLRLHDPDAIPSVLLIAGAPCQT
jgi:lantibiotic modifying enzyme